MTTGHLHPIEHFAKLVLTRELKHFAVRIKVTKCAFTLHIPIVLLSSPHGAKFNWNVLAGMFWRECFGGKVLAGKSEFIWRPHSGLNIVW